MAAMFATQTMESYSNSQQTSTPALIKIPHVSNLRFHRPVAGARIPYPNGHDENELEPTGAESSAQIVHAVDLHSLHFNIIRKNFTY